MEQIAIGIMESIGGVLVNERIVLQHHCAVLGQELNTRMENIPESPLSKRESKKKSVSDLSSVKDMETKLKDQETVIESMRLELRAASPKQEYAPFFNYL
jgi:hypothetical protein